jgi:hypothetical protein
MNTALHRVAEEDWANKCRRKNVVKEIFLDEVIQGISINLRDDSYSDFRMLRRVKQAMKMNQ